MIDTGNFFQSGGPWSYSSVLYVHVGFTTYIG